MLKSLVKNNKAQFQHPVSQAPTAHMAAQEFG